MGGASICDQADQGLHHSTVTLVGGLNIDVARQCDWSIVSWLAMTICEGVRVMVEIDGVIANVAGFDEAEETWQDEAEEKAETPAPPGSPETFAT